jgi:hypothetical protein
VKKLMERETTRHKEKMSRKTMTKVVSPLKSLVLDKGIWGKTIQMKTRRMKTNRHRCLQSLRREMMWLVQENSKDKKRPCLVAGHHPGIFICGTSPYLLCKW